MTYHAVYCGDFTSERTVLLGGVPSDAETGAQIRALHVVAGEPLRGDVAHYWVLRLGRLSGSSFMELGGSISLTGGLTDGDLKTFPLDKAPVLLSRGNLLALKVSPRGRPAPLVGLCVAAEPGSLSFGRS